MILGQRFIHLVHKFWIIIKSIQVPLDSKEGAGVPEESFQCQPEYDFTPVMQGLKGHGLAAGVLYIFLWIQKGKQRSIILFILHQGSSMMAGFRAGG